MERLTRVGVTVTKSEINRNTEFNLASSKDILKERRFLLNIDVT
jgi:hypothetical protein